MNCGWWTPPPSSVDAAARPRDALTWWDGPNCGDSASHSRYFWGLRLHLVATPSGMPIAFALAGAKADERDTALVMLDPAGSHARDKS